MQLALLASRGQLTEIPKEYSGLLFALKIHGLSIELEKEFLNNLILEDVLNKSEKGIVEHRKSLIKLIYPDHKDEVESLKEQVSKMVQNGGGVTKMSLNGKTLSPEEVNNMLRGMK